MIGFAWVILLGCWTFAMILWTFVRLFREQDFKHRERSLVLQESAIARRRKMVDEDTNEAVILICPVGLIIDVNPIACKMFGYTETELITRNVKILMPPHYAAQHDGYVRNWREGGATKIIGIGYRDVEGRKKDGTIFPIRISINEIINVDGDKIAQGRIKDISSEKYQELSKTLASLEQSKSQPGIQPAKEGS